MMREDVIELSEEYGVVITVCRNSETVCFGLDLDECDEDSCGVISGAAVDAIEKELGRGVRTDGFFPNWHGGKYYRGFKQGLAHASFRRRDIDTDDDDPDYREVGEWEWVDDKIVPADLRAKVLLAFDSALDATATAADEQERLHREAVARNAAE